MSTIVDDMPKIEEIYQTVSEKLKEVKKERGIKQKEIEQKCGLSKDTVSRAFNGKGISIANALAICRCLDISMDFLFGNNDYKDINQISRQFALGVIDKLLSLEKNANAEMYQINIAEPLDTYLKACCNASSNKIMPEQIKQIWIEDSKKKLIEAMKKKEQTEMVSYEIIS